MFILGTAVFIRPAASSPERKEDPFSYHARQLVADLLQALPKSSDGHTARLGITFANCFGGWTFGEPQLIRLRDRGPRSVSAFQSIAWFPAAAQGQTTIAHGLKVPALTFSSEFYAYYDCLLQSDHWLNANVVDITLAGAAEAMGSVFLAEAIRAPEPRNDAVVWMALARTGHTRILLDPPQRPPAGGARLEPEGGVRGSPIRGACALPLLMIQALESFPTVIHVPGLASIASDEIGHLSIWRSSGVQQ